MFINNVTEVIQDNKENKMIISDTLIDNLTPSIKPRYIDNVERACNHIIYATTSSLIQNIPNNKEVYLLSFGEAQSLILAAIMNEAGLKYTPVIVTDSASYYKNEVWKKVNAFSRKFNTKDVLHVELDNNLLFTTVNFLRNKNGSENARRFPVSIAQQAALWNAVNEVPKTGYNKPLVLSGGFLNDIIGYSSFSNFASIKKAGIQHSDTIIDKKIQIKTMRNHPGVLSAINSITPNVDVFFPYINRQVYKSICDVYLGTLFSPSKYITSLNNEDNNQLELFSIPKESDTSPGFILDMAFYMGLDNSSMFLKNISPEESLCIQEKYINELMKSFPRSYTPNDALVDLATQ